MTPAMWDQTMSELVSFLLILAIPTAITLVLLMLDPKRLRK